MHRLLKRQIAKHFGKDVDIASLPVDTLKLLEDISLSYKKLYDEKKLLEHTIDVNSQDLHQANKKITEQNISLQKLLDKTSNENEESLNLLKQYKEVIDASLIVSTTDKTGKIIYVNENFCKISGYSKEELIGKHHNVVRHPDNKKVLFREIWGTILDKKIWHGIFPNLAKNGSIYYVNATIVPLLDLHGEIVEFMALREDITKIIEHQNMIQSEKYRVSQILDNQESIIVVFDLNNSVTEANKKFYEIFNFSSLDDFKNKYSCICELFEEKENFLKQSKDTYYWLDPILDEPEKSHLAMINKRIYSVNVVVVDIDNKESYLGTFTDITVIEEAREKSQEAEKEKSNFLANMSHEIRTPMNAILGFSELLAKTSLDERQKKFVELMKNSSTTLIQIINNILDFSKLESGQKNIELLKVNPFMEFEETFMLLSYQAKEKDISYMIKIDHELEECIEVDSFHIKQILMNLIGNAIKFTHEHGKIDIRMDKYGQDSQKIIRFSVEDTGIGIPLNRQQKIFEPFSQADSSTTRQFGGTGLGLSISSSLATIIGSRLQMESKEGIGSKFYFDVKYKDCLTVNTLKNHLDQFNLYLMDLDNDTLEKISNQLKSYEINFETLNEFDSKKDFYNSIIISTDEENIKNFRYAKTLLLSKVKDDTQYQRYGNIEIFDEFSSVIYNELMRLNIVKTDIKSSNANKNLVLKILVVEDYDVNRILISELLNQFSIKYEFAFNGQEAVEKVKINKYDLILMDINMPVMNGMDATKIIIGELHSKTPIVALTANALDGDKEKCLSLGMVDYLSKPINKKAFENILIKYNPYIGQKNIFNDSNYDSGKKNAVNVVSTILDVKVSLELTSKKMKFPERIIQNIFNSFKESLDELEQNIAMAIQEQDFETIQLNTHNLKSGAATLCFDDMAKLAQELESKSRLKDKAFDYNAHFECIKSYIKIIKEWKPD